MMKTKLAFLSRLAPLAALFSCAAPKAIVVEQAPPPEPVVAAVEPEVAEPAGPSLPDDGIRLPDMVTMPKDDELRASNPGPATLGTDSGAVIARPPLDPPSRPKGGE